MTPREAAAIIQRIADSGLDIEVSDYVDLTNVAHWLAMPRPTVVCLCGSTRFYEEFRKANLRETLAGKIVLSIGVDFKSDADLLLAGELTHQDKRRLDELHLRKIDMADEVFILNCGGYVGESTQRELAYAKAHHKTIRWLEEKDVSQA